MRWDRIAQVVLAGTADGAVVALERDRDGAMKRGRAFRLPKVGNSWDGNECMRCGGLPVVELPSIFLGFHEHALWQHSCARCESSWCGKSLELATIACHASRTCLPLQAMAAAAVVGLAASPGEETLLVTLASSRLLSLDIGRLDALQVWFDLMRRRGGSATALRIRKQGGRPRLRKRPLQCEFWNRLARTCQKAAVGPAIVAGMCC